MSHYQSAGLLLDEEDLHLMLRLLTTVEQDARRTRGLPLAASVVRLKAQVEAAVAASRTTIGQQNEPDHYRLVTTAEYAQLRNVSERTARRYAQATGRFENGRWMVPIKE